MILQTIVNEENKTINEIIQKKFSFSHRLFSKIIKEKMIFVNGVFLDTRSIAKLNDLITVDLNYEEDNSNIVAKKMNIDIIYEDDGLLILNKPAGIAVHPSMLHYEDSLASGVKYYLEYKGIHKKIRPVNRLDLNTSGVVIFAKNEYIQENLIRQMEKNTFKKEYIAIVKGKIIDDKGIIDKPIARKQGSIIERCISELGQKAVTEYEVIERNNEYTVVKCTLLTGRTHQIRVHMASIGHPILGDTVYGSGSSLISRQALHSYKISFIHPIEKLKMEFIAELPESFLSMILTEDIKK